MTLPDNLRSPVDRIEKHILGEQARRDAESAAKRIKDKRLEPQTLRADIDTLSERVKDLEKQVEELRKR